MLSRLADLGHEAKIIAGFFSHLTRRRVSEYSGKLFCVERIDGVKIYRVPSVFNLTSTARKLVHHLIFMVMAIITGLLTGKCDVVIASSPPPFVALAGFVLSRIKRVPFVLEVRDLWPEDLVQEGLLSPGLVSRSMERTMAALYHRADLVLALTEGIKEGIRRRDVPAERIAVIPNSVNTDLFSRHYEPCKLRAAWGLADKFVIVYAGNHGKSNALETIIKSAALLKDQIKISFLFVGDGEQKESLVNMASSLGLDNVIFVPPQPKGCMPEIFAAADASIIPLKNVPIYDGALPNKLLDSMASGTPVIVAAGEEAQALIRKANAGVSADPESAESIAERVLYLYRNRTLAKSMGSAGRKYVIEYYSHQRMAKELERRLAHVVDPSS